MTLKKTFTPIIEGVKSVFDSVKTAVMNSKDEFKAFWDVVKFIAPLVGKAIGDSLKVVGDIAELVITIIAKVLGAIKPLLNTAIDGINLIIKGYNAVQWGKDIPSIPKIGGGSGSTATGALGNFSMSTGTVSTPSVSAITTPAGTTTGGGTTSSGIATAARVAASAASSVVSSNFNPGSFRMAEAASMGTTINLTVTGAFDREGTARTIVETLNDSFYRGTGGANSLQIA
jgi:hypothetical protein